MTLQGIGFNFFAKILKGSCVFYFSSCISSTLQATLINTVIRYLNLRSSGSKLESVTCKFTKNLCHSNFSKSFIISAVQRYWKLHLHGCFWWQLCLGNFPEWLLLKDSCKDILEIYLRNSKLHIFYISYCNVMLKKNEFLWIFVR